MKLLHTADWHIGAKWGIVDRSSDLLERAIPDIVDIALKEQVDMMLVVGDIFERQTNESLERAAQTLRNPFRELLDAKIDIALLPGNHDSFPLFRFLRSAIELVGDRDDDQGQLYILNSASVTSIKGVQIVHLPYLRSEQIQKILNDTVSELPDTIGEVHQEVGRKLDLIAQFLRGKIDHSLPALMTYHGIIKGSKVGPDEQAHEFTYHQDFMLSPESLLFNDHVAQYNALGHIHKCQELPRAVPTWYSGSIDRLSRGEKTYKPSVILVEFPNNGQRIEFERRRLPRPTPFLDENIENEAELGALCERLKPKGCELALGRITLTCDSVDSYALDQAVRDAFPRLKGVKGAVLRSRNIMARPDDITTINIKDLVNPVHTIRTYISEKMPQERKEGLFSALATVEDELNNDH